MKKIMSLLLTGVMTAMLLTGCGGSDTASSTTETTTETATTEESGEVATGAVEIPECTITFVTWNGVQEESLQNAIDGFNEIYPQVTVDLQVTAWSEYWTKLEAAATSNTMPDVITNHVIYSQLYAENGLLMPLDETDLQQYDPDFSFSNYPEGITDIYTRDEVIYGVPKDIDCIVLAYNTDIFDAAGVDYPDETWTWDTLVETAQLLDDPDSGVHGFSAYHNIQEGWGSGIYQNGGSFLSEDGTTSGFDSPEAIEALELYVDMMFEYNVSHTTAEIAESDIKTLFQSGKVAMINTGNWQLSTYVDNEDCNFDIAVLPKINGSGTNISNGLAHSVAAGTKNEAAAKAFVAYLGSEEGMSRTAIGPAVPILESARVEWAEIHADQFNTQVVLDSIEEGVPYVATINRSTWEAALNVYIEKIFNGEISVEEGLTAASVEINAILAEE